MFGKAGANAIKAFAHGWSSGGWRARYQSVRNGATGAATGNARSVNRGTRSIVCGTR